MKSVLISLVWLLMPLHQFHSSITQIDHDPKKRTLEITVRMFSDDIILALTRSGAPKIYLGSEKDRPLANKYLEDYLRKHLSLTLNGNRVQFKYLGNEAQLDATWCYLEVSGVSTVHKLEVDNTLLTTTFDDQTNMVNLSINGRKKSGLARKGRTLLKFEY